MKYRRRERGTARLSWAPRVSRHLSGAVFSRTMTRNGGGRRAMEYRNSPRPANIFGITSYLIWVVLQILIALPVAAQTRVPLQPFAHQLPHLQTTLAYLGHPLPQNHA